MTTLFLLVMGVCQSLNELGVVSVTKKWSGQNRTTCYGPGTCALSYYVVVGVKPTNNCAIQLLSPF